MNALNWRVVPLIQVVTIERGTEPGSNSYCLPEEGIRFLRVSDISKKIIAPTYTNSKDLIKVSPKDVLLVLDGSPGYVAKGFSGAISSGIRKVKPLDPHILSNNWLYFVLQSPQVQATIQSHTYGITITHASSAIPYISIPLPPISEQRQIVKILALSNALKQLQFKVKLQLGNFPMALFCETFGHPSQWQDTVQLGEVVEFIGGGTPSRKIQKYFTGDIPWATSKDIKSRYLHDAQEHITEEAIQNSATRLVPKDTILIVVKSKILAHSLPVTITTRSFCFGQDLKGLVCNPGIEPQFIADALIAQSQYILDRARGVNTEGLTLEILRRVPIPKIGSIQQQQYVKRITILNEIENATMASSKIITDLAQSLLTHASTGELTTAWRKVHVSLLAAETRQQDAVLDKEMAVQQAKIMNQEAVQREIRQHAPLAIKQLVQSMTSTIRLMENSRGELKTAEQTAKSITSVRDYLLSSLKSGPMIDLSQIIMPSLPDFSATVNQALWQSVGELSRVYQESLAVSFSQIQQVFTDLTATYQPVLEVAAQLGQIAAEILKRPDKTHPRHYILHELSDKQYALYLGTIKQKNYFTLKTLLDGVNSSDTTQVYEKELLPLDRARRTLTLLETLGLIAHVTVERSPTDETIFYISAYRALTIEDDSRDDDLKTLETAFPELIPQESMQ